MYVKYDVCVTIARCFCLRRVKQTGIKATQNGSWRLGKFHNFSVTRKLSENGLIKHGFTTLFLSQGLL